MENCITMWSERKSCKPLDDMMTCSQLSRTVNWHGMAMYHDPWALQIPSGRELWQEEGRKAESRRDMTTTSENEHVLIWVNPRGQQKTVRDSENWL